MVLSCEASITEIAVGIPPILNTAVVVEAQFVGNNKRHLCVLQTLPEEQQAPHTTVAILKRMDTFETHVEIQDVIERHLFERIVVGEQRFHVTMNVFGRNRLLFAYLIGKALVIAHDEPGFAAVGGVGFEDSV